MRDTAGSHERSMVQSQSWRSADVGKAPGSRQSSASRNSAGQGNASSRSHHSWQQKPMVQVTISWGSQLQSAEANIVQCFIVQQERLIRVLHQLMETQDCLGMGLALPNETRKCWECRKVSVWLCLKHIILIQDALYGSTTVSDTFGEGITGEGFHNASIVQSSWKMSARHVWKLNLVKGTEKN